MRPIEEISMIELRVVIKLLNQSGLLEETIDIFGKKKEDAIDIFSEKVRMCSNVQEKLPVEVVNFYNFIHAPLTKEEIACKKQKEQLKEERREEIARKRKEGELPAVPGGRIGFQTFADIKEYILRKKRPTNFIDLALLEGGTAEEISKKARVALEEAKMTIKGSWTPGFIRSHIKYRQSKRWVFEISGDENDPTYRLVDYKVRDE